jgi:hypothetical protein
MRTFIRTLLATAIFTAAVAIPAKATPSFVGDPSGGNITGLPGSTVGWGFIISNPDGGMLLVTGSEWIGADAAAYTDFIGPYPGGIIVGDLPYADIVSLAFNLANSEGVGSFTISPSAPIDTVYTGTIRIFYDYYSLVDTDPNFEAYCLNGNGPCTTMFGENFDFAVSVEVVTPEPSSLAYTFLGAALLLGQRRLSRRR